MRGRKPKPVELRVLHGGAYGKALAEQPQPRRCLPRCPDHLEGEAAACWKRLARELYDAGLLSAIDRDALAAYCTAYARYKKAEAEVARHGEVVETATKVDAAGNVTGGGNTIQNPWLAIANRALEQMSKLAAEFGMTPSSRSRVKAEISAAKSQAAKPTRAPAVKPGADDADPRKALG
jgi:P27 family predicted phage terminase small subunit